MPRFVGLKRQHRKALGSFMINQDMKNNRYINRAPLISEKGGWPSGYGATFRQM